MCVSRAEYNNGVRLMNSNVLVPTWSTLKVWYLNCCDTIEEVECLSHFVKWLDWVIIVAPLPRRSHKQIKYLAFSFRPVGVNGFTQCDILLFIKSYKFWDRICSEILTESMWGRVRFIIFCTLSIGTRSYYPLRLCFRLSKIFCFWKHVL